MAKRPALVTQSDLNKAVKAAAAAPEPMAVEVRPDGTITIIPYYDRRKNNGLPSRAQPTFDKEPDL